MSGRDRRIDRAPHHGEELNTGEVTKAREAASVIVLRDGRDGPEVLLVQRNPAQRFMGGAWVFPGGAVHEGDGDPAETGRRELEEEAALALPDTSGFVPFSRWITPEEAKIRFDTYFYVAEAPAGADPRCDGEECVDLRWMRPADALAAYRQGDLSLVFPTIKHLEQLAEFDSVAQALESARGREVEPVMPKILMHDESAEIVLPGEPGYGD
ncbi:MAG TPA: NUDIX domain-containing protein [Thermoleophilaceae bacterium]|nr:NUDIX domain-containing protein [Thermoleophilaceae bacterium]